MAKPQNTACVLAKSAFRRHIILKEGLTSSGERKPPVGACMARNHEPDTAKILQEVLLACHIHS